MDFPDLAETYISCHSNPLKKVECFGSKLFLSALNEEQEQLKERCLARIEANLAHARVERRVARSLANWMPEQAVAKVTKDGKITVGFGFQNKHGKFLSPEEVLFLLEMNRIELFFKNLPLSIEEAFKNIKHLEKYLCYKKLLLQGYKLKDKSHLKNKHVLDEDAPPAKLSKLEKDKVNDFDEIFAKLRESGPKVVEPRKELEVEADYEVQMSSCIDKSKHMNLIIRTGQHLTSQNINGKKSDIFVLSAVDDVAFYKFWNANIPILP